MRNLEGMPTEEESAEDISPENIDLSGQLEKVAGGEIREIKETTEEQQEPAEQPEQLSFEKNIEAVETQEEEIRIEARERDDKGILSRLSQKGNKFAGMVVLSLASFAAGCNRGADASENSGLKNSPKIENVSRELPEKRETIMGKRNVAKSSRPAERIDVAFIPKKEGDERFVSESNTSIDRGDQKDSADAEAEEKAAEKNNKRFAPESNAPIIRGPERHLDDAGKQAPGREGLDKGAEEKAVKKNNEGFALGSSAPAERGFEMDLAEEYRQAHSKEKPIISRQAERRVMENFHHFIKNSNVVSLKDGSFAVDIGINRGSDDRAVAETGERPCYKVEPEDLAELERIRREHLRKVNFALSKRPFIPTEVVEGIRKRTERSLKRAIMYCEKIPEGQLPEEIKESRIREQEEIKSRKEEIINRNKRNKVGRGKIENENTGRIGTEIKRETSEETPEQRLKRRIKEIREIREEAENREQREGEKIEKGAKTSSGISNLEKAVEEMEELKQIEGLIKSGRLKEATERFKIFKNENQTK